MSTFTMFDIPMPPHMQESIDRFVAQMTTTASHSL